MRSRAARVLRRAAITVVTVVVMVGLSPIEQVRVDAPAQSVPVGDYAAVAHRGAMRVSGITENTLRAFAWARNQGATAVELDVRLTRDDKFVVMHSARLGTTTTCSGYVTQRTLREIQAHCRGKVGGERIPSLSEFLTWARDRRINVLLELKRDPNGRWDVAHLARIERAVRARDLWGRLRILSVSRTLLTYAERSNPLFRTQAIARLPSEIQDLAARFDGVNICADDVSAQLVEELHGQGKLVLGRNTDSPVDWWRFRQAGVDGVLADRIDRYLAWQRDPRPGIGDGETCYRQ